MTRAQWWSTVSVVSLLAAACGSGKRDGAGGAAVPMTDQIQYQTKDLPAGLDLRVSDGKLGAPAYDHAALAPAKKLGDAEARGLLARAKPLAADPADPQAFALRGRSTPPPRTGTTITGTFPPDPSTLLPPKASDAGQDLTVLRYMPEGKVPLAPELSVTFSQPMVAVTSQPDAAATTPVTLQPPTRGRWRWLGTRTALFDPEVRFPQATTYTVEIPAGTKSASGTALKAATRFTFETPPPSIVTHFPDSAPQKLDVPIYLLFDQQIDARAVLAKIAVTANGKAQRVRMLDAAEIEKHKPLAAMIAAATKEDLAGRWVAFRTTQPLPADAAIDVTVPAGTPSAEGPNTTTAAQHVTFRTFPPLKLERAECGWGGECHPGMPFQFVFNTPIDEDTFDESLVTVQPAIPGMHVVAQGSTVMVQGETTAHTTYDVTIAGTITDTFGQKLGARAERPFKVGDAMPTFFGPNGMVVLDPAATKHTLDFFSTTYDGLTVKLYSVTPADYDAFGAYMRNQWNHDHPPKVPGTKRFEQRIQVAGGHDALTETALALQPALGKAGLGHVVAVVEPYPWKETYDPPRMVSWVQSTQLAVDAYVDADNLIAFATELATGKPAANVALEIRPFGIKGTTDDKGMATLPLGAGGLKGAHYLIATRGDDVAFVAEDGGWWNEYGNWVKTPRPTQLAWYVVDDRKLYKPGEQVTLKGWLRTVETGKGGDIGGIANAVTSVVYTVTDANGTKIGQGTAPVNGVGAFDTSFVLPKTPNLGYATVAFESQGTLVGTYAHSFRIEEFRRPEFEVTAQASAGPFLVGGAGDVTVTAKYYAGGPLPGADTQWNVTASQTSFTPPNRDEFIFGAWQPWWGGRADIDGGGEDDEPGGRGGYQPPKTWNLASKTDATGAHTLHLDFLSVKPAMPMTVIATASVTDVNRQMWSASSALIVHPSSLYVGLKTKRPFVEKGQPFDIDVIGVDVDGKAQPGAKIEVTAARLDWEFKKGRYVTKEVDPQTCAVVAAAAAVPCQFKTTAGGTYQVVATIVDTKGRPNQTTLTFWVSGGEQPPAREVQQETVTLIPDKKDYTPGNTAEILVQAPFSPAEGVVSWRRSGIVKTERITLTGPTTVLKVPITDQLVPNLVVQVDLVGAAPRSDDHGTVDPKLPKRPAYAVGTLNLSIPPRPRTLAVTVTPNVPKLAPGESAKLAIDVRDAEGKPVADAETAVIVVDEAILALSAYQFPSPIDAFYSARGADARDFYLRSYVKLAHPDLGKLATTTSPATGRGMALADAAPAPSMANAKEAEEKPADNLQRDESGFGGEADGKRGGAAPAIAIRSNFNPLAAFAPAVHTDARGHATVDIKVPDNLTRYRIVAIASAGTKQFGKGESALTARLPLMVRPSPPRFLNFGDTFRLPVVVQNQTDAAMTVKLAVRATNAAITDGAGREVTVPPNDRVEVQFPAAAEMAGTARFQIVGTAGTASDAAEVALPVWTPATTEGFATYGVIENGRDGVMRQPVALPGAVVTQFGGLEVTTASTNLQALTDAMLYVVHYPYACAEQRSSRILAIAALRDVLTAFKVKDMPAPAALEASVAADLEHLSQMQNADGGFAFWDRGYPSEPYLTVYVASALAHAKDKGYAVPANVLDGAKQYLRVIESHYPSYYDEDIRHTISAYALSTRKALGDLDVAKAKQLYASAGGAEKLSMEADGWLLATFARSPDAATQRKELVRHALNKVSETAGAANFTTSYGDGAHLILASDRRVDAVMLDALIQEDPTLDLIPKVVTGLLAHRTAGRWLNTQENTFALLALDRSFQTYEKATPDFTARVWLGADYAGEHAFRGRSTDDFQIRIPMKDVATHDKRDLTIQKDGAGRLYYRVGMTYAPASLQLAAADYGFVVERAYEAIDDAKDVTRDAAGAWHIKAGARVRVRISMANENRRYQVALVDPLPAGLEAMNPALAVTGPIPTDPSVQKQRGAYWWWYGPWYDHQNMRDERIEAFASELWEGVHTYVYVARATTPGTFVVPPPKAEEMYMPETFGRGASDRVIVE